MGINGLWEVCAPAACRISNLSRFTVTRACCKNGPAPHLPYVVGVDASGWFEQCQQGKWHRAHAQTGQNPALRTFLFRLARLARYPLQLIFCYDGDQRPGVKRGHRVSSNEHWMVKPTQRILDAFNTQWITAAGEAEAQLALMNRAGVINAVMTDDCDIFVFGAQTVLRNSTFLSDTIKIYTIGTIREQVDPSLTGDAFITIAICCGGDYDKNGLPGCGRETALGLARCMDNSMLCSAMHGGNQDRSLQQWRNIAEYHLASDPTGKMGRLHPALARSLSDSFPNPGIINLYARPTVTPLTELPKLRTPAPPNLTSLASLIQQLLGWDSKKLLGTFRTTIWPVAILHELLEDLANNSPMSNEVCGPCCSI
ncbi:PIN domain-like protein [Suillus paluster]|uniref:PIN domain-like protein n=1 Tax=Suillus paluster TaxID=48578 RepID=UPI001B8787C5|nr:PIN domain-like protein [Suillus paluster]XP_041183412.1 PIN domain-like protein [Suillus paluster]KAG1723370.1 PIN domain-like protein [Suillus paluster]KAG1754080.1 PIN domain-like protein [Suillus paluster]